MMRHEWTSVNVFRRFPVKWVSIHAEECRADAPRELESAVH